MAFHAAARHSTHPGDGRLGPVTELLALREFAGQESIRWCTGWRCATPFRHWRRRRLDHHRQCRRTRWAPEPVSFAKALAAANRELNSPREVCLRVLPIPGHCSFPEWHDDAAAMVAGVMS